MKARILKWGNSLAIRVPKVIADEMKVSENSSIEMTMQDGALVIKPDAEGRWNLEELLAEVTAENVHGEWETGPPTGKEQM